MRAIIKKELQGYFASPLGYVFLAIYFFFGGWFFKTMVIDYAITHFSYLFTSMFTINLFVIPILTMRLMSEDKRQKTDQLLMTAPVSPWGIVAGKYFAALIVFIVSHIIFVIEAVSLLSFGTIEWTVFLTEMLGSVLLGAAFIAVGLFISSITESQVVAAVSTFAVSMVVMMMDNFKTDAVPWLNQVLDWMSFSGRYNDFMIGVFNYADAVFFLSIAAVFLFLTVRLQEKKRWS